MIVSTSPGRHWHIVYSGTRRLVAPIAQWRYTRLADAERAVEIIRRTPGHDAGIAEKPGSVSSCRCRN
jgi:hypothetical protein